MIKLTNEYKKADPWIATINYMLENDLRGVLEIMLEPDCLLEWEYLQEEETRLHVGAINEVFAEMEVEMGAD